MDVPEFTPYRPQSERPQEWRHPEDEYAEGRHRYAVPTVRGAMFGWGKLPRTWTELASLAVVKEEEPPPEQMVEVATLDGGWAYDWKEFYVCRVEIHGRLGKGQPLTHAWEQQWFRDAAGILWELWGGTRHRQTMARLATFTLEPHNTAPPANVPLNGHKDPNGLPPEIFQFGDPRVFSVPLKMESEHTLCIQARIPPDWRAVRPWQVGCTAMGVAVLKHETLKRRERP